MDSTSSSAWSQAKRKSSHRCLKASSAASVAAIFSPPDCARASRTVAAAVTNSSYAALSTSTVTSIPLRR
uniref:Uncharacterized protein n=1 Tax=Arundo donax TaxID=35708 RepID=A0A0A9G749_ARUDO